MNKIFKSEVTIMKRFKRNGKKDIIQRLEALEKKTLAQENANAFTPEQIAKNVSDALKQRFPKL